VNTALRIELPAPASGRISVLDELKGVAILLIILYHAGGVLVWRDTLHLEVGVDMFVILSGIGLTLSSTNEGSWRFLLRRFWRIYPGYWIILTSFLLADAHFLGLQFGTKDIVLHYLGVHAFFGDAYMMTINDSFWFISLIVGLYAVFALIRRFVGRPDLIVFFGAVASIVPTLAYFYAGQSNAFSHLALRIPGFFLGLLIGQLLRTGRLEVRLSWALGAALGLVLYVPYVNGLIFASFWVGLSVMALYALLLRPVFTASERTILRFLGERSLEIFLIHQPLIRAYNILAQEHMFPGRPMTPWSIATGMAVALAVTVLISHVLHSLLGRLPAPGRGRPPAGPGQGAAKGAPARPAPTGTA